MIPNGPPPPDEPRYDVVVVGGGVVGAVLTKVLAELAHRDRRSISILLLEAGRGAGLSAASYQSYLDAYYRASIKTPNAPYPNAPNAMTEEDLAFLKPPAERYYRQRGPLPFGSNGTRALGGTTLHWMGIALRMMPSDFRMNEHYGKGEDWPITYENLRPYYEKAEWEIGVAGAREDQLRVPGMREEDFGDYEYPMERIPLSYMDRVLTRALGDFEFTMDSGKHPVRLVSIPQARNSTPRVGGDPRDYLDEHRRFDGRKPYRPFGAPEDPSTGPGQRCEGNASCIPICPARAKYTALKTIQQVVDLSRLQGIHVEIATKAVATDLRIDPDSGRVAHIRYLQYEDERLPYATPRKAVARRFVLAANAIENAKLLLASRNNQLPDGASNLSGCVGRYLMDHPFVLAWGLTAPDNPVGAFRGPGATCDLPMRDGAFRAKHAAFRTDVGNWGWSLADDAPSRDVERMIDPEAFRGRYASKPHGDLLPRQALYGAELRQRLHSVVPRQVALGFLMEQLPEAGNRVTIDDDWRDQLRVHRPVIEYDISEYTRAGIAISQQFAAAFFERAGVRSYTDQEAALGQPLTYNGAIYRYIGAGHIMGTHRMGRDRNRSVVNEFQRSWDHENLYIAGCGSMPTAGTSNPTLTATALAIRTAEAIYRELDLAHL